MNSDIVKKYNEFRLFYDIMHNEQVTLIHDKDLEQLELIRVKLQCDRYEDKLFRKASKVAINKILNK
jgi:hypothetical protein